MLDTGSKEQLTSYLSSDLGVNSVTIAESGLSIQLAANCAYYVDLMASVESDGDGMQYRLQPTGTARVTGMTYTEAWTDVTAPFALSSTYAFPSKTTVFMAQGIVITGSAGRLYLEVRKDTNTGGPSIIATGAHLVARRI